MSTAKLTYGSLFAGIGGMDLGLERAGLECRWQVEIDEFARRVLAKHWPHVRRHDDVKTFPPSEGEWRVDVIAGGFPCQDISFAGKGAGLQGERSGLWFEFARVVRDLRPRYVLVENVSALLVRGLDAVLGTLASLGYDAEWHCIPAAHVGAPHIRDRVFILGHAGGVGWDERRDDHGGDVRDLSSSAAQDADRMAHPGRKQSERRRGPGDLACEAGSGQGDGQERQRHGDAAVDRRPDVADADRQRQRQPGGPLCEVGGRLGDFRETVGRAQWGCDPADGPEPRMGRVAHGVPNRVHRLRGLGNAVVPQVAEFIGRRLIEFHELAQR